MPIFDRFKKWLMLRKWTLFVELMLFASGLAIAQDRVLFTVDNRETVTADEFKAVFNKNREIGEQIDPKTPEEYLQLYIDFKLKVLEAKDSALDERPSFQREFKGYRNQLARPYLRDQSSEEELVKEAYNRMQFDVEASHIMIAVQDFKNSKDTSDALQTLREVKSELENGIISFEEAAKTYSNDTYSAKKGGSLGYFSVFDMVYEFESEVYKLEEGEVSPIFRTQYGYHIARLDSKRAARGKISAAHIMLLLPEDADAVQSEEVERKIRELHQKLINGESTFEDLVAQFSQDKTSKGKGGRLPEFGINDMVESFEEAAFNLKNEGDISEPVRTPYGWHIIKLVEKKPMPSFEEAESELAGKIKRDVRSQLSEDRFIAKLADEYNFKVDEKAISALSKKLNREEFSDEWEIPESLAKDQTVLATYADSAITVQDMMKFVEKNKRNIRSSSAESGMLNVYMEILMENHLLAYEDSQLERKYPEFRRLVNEYQDGILLFDLTDKKIWSKSMKDTVGLEDFYERNKDKYRWDTRYDYTEYDCAKKKLAKKVLKSIKKGELDSLLLKKYNSDSSLNLQLEHFVKEDASDLVKLLTVNEVSDIQERNDRYFFIRLNKVLPPQQKELKNIKGLVAADYQKELEAQWIGHLRETYPVEVNDEVLQSVVNELQH